MVSCGIRYYPAFPVSFSYSSDLILPSSFRCGAGRSLFLYHLISNELNQLSQQNSLSNWLFVMSFDSELAQD